MGLAGGGVDHDLLHVRLLDGLKNGLEMSLGAPVGEALIDVVPMPKLFGKVAPWRAGGGDPKDRVDELALIAAAAAAVLWDEGKDEGPFLAGQGVVIFSHEGL